MADTKLKEIVIALVIMSMVALGISGFYGSAVTQYNIPNVKNLSSMSVASDMESMANQMQEKIKSAPPAGQAFYITVEGPYTVLTMVFSSIVYYLAIISDTVALLGLPPYLVGGLVTMFVIFVVWKVLGIVFRTET